MGKCYPIFEIGNHRTIRRKRGKLMIKSKRYFWLKLEESFFSSLELISLRKVPGGEVYTIIYLKMLLLSLRDNGTIFYQGIGKDIASEISDLIKEDMLSVSAAIEILISLKLITVCEGDEESYGHYSYYLNRLPEMTGCETEAARIKREQRLRKKMVLNPPLEEGQRLTTSGQCPSKESYISNSDGHFPLEKEQNLDTEYSNIDVVVSLIKSLTGITIKREDAAAILRTADGDLAKIRSVPIPKRFENMTGYYIRAIQDGYKTYPVTMPGRHSSSYEGRRYTHEELDMLEHQLLENDI